MTAKKSLQKNDFEYGCITIADFHKGVENGAESYKDDDLEGYRIQSADDVWRIIEGEISPHVIQKEGNYNPVLGIPDVSLAQRVGFLVGYLTSAFAPQLPISEISSLPARPCIDSAGFPLDM